MTRRSAKSSRKQPRPSRRQSLNDAPASPTETRAADALTSAWMLTALNALVVQVLWIVLRALLHYNADLQKMQVVASLLLLVAVVLGIAVIVLTPIVYRVRRVPPPRSVSTAALLIGLSPVAAVLALWLVERGG
jgi:hypothetical protein